MDAESLEAIFEACEKDVDRVSVAHEQIRKALQDSTCGEADKDSLTKRLNLVLDRVNQISFSPKFLPKNVANDFISDLVKLISVKDVELTCKFGWVIINFLNKQGIILEKDVLEAAEYFIATLEETSPTSENIPTMVPHLRALGTVIYGNVWKLKNIHGKIISSARKMSRAFAPFVSDKAILESDRVSFMCATIQCIRNLTTEKNWENIMKTQPECPRLFLDEGHQLIIIQEILINLQRLRAFNCVEDCIYYRAVRSGIKGMRNIIEMRQSLPKDLVPSNLFSIVLSYSIMGYPVIPGQEPKLDVNGSELSPDKAEDAGCQSMPTKEGGDSEKEQKNGTLPEMLEEPQSCPKDEGSVMKADSNSCPFKSTSPKSPTVEPKEDELSKVSCDKAKVAKASSEGGELELKQRNESSPEMFEGLQSFPKDGCSEKEVDSNSSSSKSTPPKSLEMNEDNLSDPKISNSDISDGEQSQVISRARYSNLPGKIRSQSLTLFQIAAKCLDKKSLFTHWQTIFPDRHIHSWKQLSEYPLLFAIMRDPTHKTRLAALSILVFLLDGSKQFLTIAEDESKYRNAAYTSTSVSLGIMVKQLHRCLLMALVNEEVSLVLVQIVKCISLLVLNSPYDRLAPGLLSQVVRVVGHFISHKDATIKVVALTCLGNVMTAHFPLMEISRVLESKPPMVNFSTSGFFHPKETSNGNEESLFVVLSSGLSTPTFKRDEKSDFEEDDFKDKNMNVPWLVKSCMKIVMSGCKVREALALLTAPNSHYAFSDYLDTTYVHALPVRVEALQLLTLMTQTYFDVIRPCLKTVHIFACNCLLSDAENSIHLHAVKLIEALTAAILRNQSDDKATSELHVSIKESSHLWSLVLKGPIQRALSNNSDAMVEMVACESLGNIGPNVFESLSEDVTVFIKTIMLGFASATNHHISVGALSTIGRLVTYPCLINDPLFLADASNAILRSLKTNNLAVVSKAAWALSNLSDALVTKRMDESFMKDISEGLLLKLLENSVELCLASEKPRSNAIRTVGNLLNFLPPSFLDTGRFDGEIKRGLELIIKHINLGCVKVRWNACYALGNIMWNEPVLSLVSHKMMEAYTALEQAVRTCRNFKVKISAAKVLAIPSRREMYFQGDESKSSARLYLGQESSHRKHSIGHTDGSSINIFRYVMRNRQDFDRFHPGNYTMEVDVETEFGMTGCKSRRVGCPEDCFGMVWNGVLSTLLECETSPVDLTERKYWDQLEYGLTITLLHLLSLVSPGDLESCQRSLEGHEKKIQRILQRRCASENGTGDDKDGKNGNKPCDPPNKEAENKAKVEDGLKRVASHFSKLPRCASMNQSHLSMLESLSTIFVLLAPGDKLDETTGSNMELKFFQVYD